MEKNMVLIMVDECGDELELDRFACPDFDGDEDALDIWKERKIDKAWEEYPEARNIYFEDRRGWSKRINASICGLDWSFADDFLYGAP